MSTVLLHCEGPVAIVTISRPEALNALNQETIRSMGQVLAEVEADDSVKVVVLTGDGPKSFVSGADIVELQGLADADAALRLTRAGHAVFTRIEAMAKPVIACVNGFAFGGGLELALCADIRVAASTAKLGLPELGLGIIPGYGGTQRLARLVGASRAKLMLFTARSLSAEDALRVGLVDEVFSAEALKQETMALAQSIAAKSAGALATTKRLVEAAVRTTLADGLELEAHAFAVISQTSDAKAGLMAFLERRRK